MPLKTFAELMAQADGLREPVQVVAAGGADATVIQALEIARQRGWVSPILTGEPRRIQDIAESLEIDLAPFRLIEDADDSAVKAVNCVQSGKAALLMKGQLPTPNLMKAVLNKETGLRTGKTICQVVLMEIPRDDRAFLLTDTGVTIDPSLQQMRELIEHVVNTAQRLGCEVPNVALMSATEKVTTAMPETVQAEELVQAAASGSFGACAVGGPLSFDLAYAKDAGQKKGLAGQVHGAADAMVFSNLLAANLTVKAIMYTADCRFGGVLCGTRCPVVFMSRADSVETRVHSLAYAIQLLADGRMN